MADTTFQQQQINTGSFLPTTNIWDTNQLDDINVNSDDFKELLVRLYQNINNIALAVNTKDTGFYVLEEFVNGQLFFNANTAGPTDLKPVFRRVYNVTVSFNNTDTIQKAHYLSINEQWSFTRIYGAASNTTTLAYYPIPFAGAAGAYISMTVDSSNIVIVNESGVDFDTVYLVVEYIKY
jgi:hypothetical protein